MVSESEWEEDEGSDSKSDDNDDESYEEEEEEEEEAREDAKPPPKQQPSKQQYDEDSKPAASSPTPNNSSSKSSKNVRRRKVLRRVDFDKEDDTIDHLTSTQRLTERGGYMHTLSSRKKISQANRGNTPWNKGKTRPASTKSNISAGVRARNRAILQQKLQAFNMTEEEWNAAKKQVKLMRERLRKMRATKKKLDHAMAGKKRKRNSQLTMNAATDDEEEEEEESESLSPHSPVQEEEASDDNSETDLSPPNNKTQDIPILPLLEENASAQEEPPAGLVATELSEEERQFEFAGNPDQVVESPPTKESLMEYAEMLQAAALDIPPIQQPAVPAVEAPPALDEETKEPEAKNPISLFRRDHEFTPHDFDRPEISYQSLCPEGGPGGLICCEKCCVSYSKFLSSTVRDIQRDRTKNLQAELRELIDFTQDTKSTLLHTIKAARKVPIPLRRHHFAKPPPASTTTTTTENDDPPMETM